MSFEDQGSPALGGRFETPQPSRRELREAERLRTEPVAVDPFIEIAKVDAANPEVSALFGLQPSTVVRESAPPLMDVEVVGSRSRNSKKSGRAPSKSFAKLARARGNETAPRKLRRAEVRIVRAADAPKHDRKNPFSVLVTMLAVGGMVAVAGLPAYAAFTNQAVIADAKTDAATQDLTRSRNGHGPQRPPRRIHRHEPGRPRRDVEGRHPRRSQRGLPRLRRPRDGRRLPVALRADG